MKRILRFSLNLGLVVFSTFVAFHALAMVDGIAGWFLPQRDWPGPAGLLFIPGTEDNYEMHDYTCTDHINSLGFRDREFGLKKTSTIRAIAIGDSFTYGWGVNIEDAWCKRLEANLRKQGIDIEILNLGKPAAGPRDYAAIAECAIPRLKPDIVIVCLLAGEDLGQLGDALSFDPENYLKENYPNLLYLVQYANYVHSGQGASIAPKRTYADVRKWYADTAREVTGKMSDKERARFDKLEDPVKEAFFQGKLNPWMIGQTTESSGYFMNTLRLDDLRAQIRKTQECFRRIKKVADRNGARLLVLTIPEGFYVNREAYKNVQRIGFHVVPEMLQCNVPDQAVGEACKRAGITSFHSVTDEFRKHTDETGFYFEFDRHMTPAGNALYAALVAPIIAAEIGNTVTPKDATPSQ